MNSGVSFGTYCFSVSFSFSPICLTVFFCFPFSLFAYFSSGLMVLFDLFVLFSSVSRKATRGPIF